MNKENEDLKKLIEKFVKDREWTDAHNPKNLSMSISIEAAELMELFQWMTIEDSKKITNQETLEHIKEELADVLIYCLSLANQFGFNINKIVKEKIRKNSFKYPL